MSDDDQFDLFGSRSAHDEALARITAHAGDWITIALRTMLHIEAGPDLTGENIRQQLLAMGCPPPHHHNAWGALIREAVQRGILADTGRYAQMASKRSHARRTPVYRRRAA